MRIGTVASHARVGVETIRFYERKGLISQPPKPLDGGFRGYPERTVQRVRFIRRAQGLGFSLAEIEDLLSLETDPNTDCSAVRARAQGKRDEVRQKIAALGAIEAALGKIVKACPGRGPASERCSILESLRSDEHYTRGEPL